MTELDDKQKEKIWEEIQQAISYSAKPKPGEFTKEQIAESTGLTVEQLRRKLKKLVEEDVLGVRKISVEGARFNVYFPLQEVAMEDVLALLTE